MQKENCNFSTLKKLENGAGTSTWLKFLQDMSVKGLRKMGRGESSSNHKAKDGMTKYNEYLCIYLVLKRENWLEQRTHAVLSSMFKS